MGSGNWWESLPQANGQAVPANPLKVREMQGQIGATGANTTRTVVQTQGDLIDNRTKAATQAALIAKARAEALNAQNTANGMTPENIYQNQQRTKNMSALNDIIGSLTNQYEQNFRGNGGSSGRGVMAELVPGSIFGVPVNSTNQLFDSTAMRAGPFIKSLLFPGSKDTDAAAEYQQKIMPFIPQSRDSDEVITDKIKQLRNLYNKQMNVKMSQGGAAVPQQRGQSGGAWGKVTVVGQ